MLSIARLFIINNNAKNANTAKNIRLLNTFIKKKELTRDRIWSQLELPDSVGGKPKKISIETLPEILFEDCIDLIMNHYVKDEVTQNTTGVLDRPESFQECKEFLASELRMPTTHTHVYLIHDETKPKPELVGFSSMTLKSKDNPDLEDECSMRTEEMKRYLEISQALTRLYPKKNIFDRYKIDYFYEDVGLAIHPNYRLLGVAKYDCFIRKKVCKSHGVPVTAAWCTMIGSLKACEFDNWETLYDISSDELESYLGIRFKHSTPRYKYMATTVNH